jgi:hypothetical protein
MHLSSGQSALFNVFTTIVRYADMGDVRSSTSLSAIKGIVLIDEIDAHLHCDLQHEVLPKLLGMFPKVQFLLALHSPLALMGLEKTLGKDAFTIFELPSGNVTSVEAYSEFTRSYEHYKATRAFDADLQRLLAAGPKPLVLTEGETDADYLRTATELAGKGALLDRIDIQCVGSRGAGNGVHAGKSGLDQTRSLLAARPEVATRRVLLLYDSDAKRPDEDQGRLSVRSMPFNPKNTWMRRGVENLLPEALIADGYWDRRTEDKGDGKVKDIRILNKRKFCDHICKARRDPSDFEEFGAVVRALEEFAGAAQSQ